MKIQALSPAQTYSSTNSVNLCKPKSTEAKFSSPLVSEQLASISSLTALAQLPNVSFGAKRHNYGRDNFEAYASYDGPPPPEIEINKYRLSRLIQEDIDSENYLSAIKGKITLAEICKSQNKEDDAYMLEESIRRLYKDLPKYQRNEAKDAIRAYNSDMAAYIDSDIESY